MKSLYRAALASLVATGLAQGAQGAQGQVSHAAFVTTIGKDTFCLEQYTRNGDVVTGTWVVFHPPGVFVHDYHITLGPNGVPLRYTMKYSTPGAPKPDFDSVIVQYGRDTATYTTVFGDSAVTLGIPMRDAFPLLGQSWVGLELGLARLRRMGVDSSVIVTNAPSQSSLGATRLPVKFVGRDSVIMGNIRAQISEDGSIRGMTAGQLTIHRVASLDMPALTKSFVDAFAPRAAALAAAAASRVEIAVPAATLDKLVGEYALNATNSITVTREGQRLVASIPNGGRLELLAQTQTQFFVRKPDLVFVFDVDANSVATAVTLVQGEGKQRLAKLIK